MRAWFAGMCVALVMGPSIINAALVANYAWEYNYYVNVLCENKGKPELKCNGACHLKKELVEVHSPEAPSLPEIDNVLQWMCKADNIKYVLPSQLGFHRAWSACECSLRVRTAWLRRIDQPPERIASLVMK